MTGFYGEIHLSRSCFIWTKSTVLVSTYVCLALGTMLLKYLSRAFTRKVGSTLHFYAALHVLLPLSKCRGRVNFLPYYVLFCNILPFLLIPACPFWMQIQDTWSTHVSLVSFITYRNKCSQSLFSKVISKTCWLKMYFASKCFKEHNTM